MAELPENDRITGPFIAVAGQTDFPADFPLIDAPGDAPGSCVVFVRERAGVTAELTLGAFSVPATTDGGFTLRLVAVAEAGDRCFIVGRQRQKRLRAHPAGGAIRTPTLEDDARELAARAQEARRDLDLAVVAPLGETGLTLPPVASRTKGVAWFNGAAIAALVLAAGEVVGAHPVTGAPIGVPPNFVVDSTTATVSSRFAAANAIWPVIQTYIQTQGYLTAGDAGRALYKRVEAEPAHPGKFQSADGVWWEIAEPILFPEQFGATDPAAIETAQLQAWLDAMGDWPGAGKARDGFLLRTYRLDATLFKRPYTSIGGVGRGRCGFRPVLTTGPAMDCDSVVNDSSAYLDRFDQFTFDMSDCTGDAYALRLQGQKHVALNSIAFWNAENSTAHQLQISGTCYSINLRECNFLNNQSCLKVNATGAGTGLFPTTVDVYGTVFEDSPQTLGEAILLEDASGVTFHPGCVMQSLRQKTWIKVVGGPVRATRHLHRFLGLYIEWAEANQAGSRTFEFIGQVGNLVDWCEIRDAKIHGPAPAGGHVYAQYTDRLTCTGNSVAPDHVWLTDGGNNVNPEIDARFLGDCPLQRASYSTTVFEFSDQELITFHDGGVLEPSVAKQAVGRFLVVFNRAFRAKLTPDHSWAWVDVKAFDGGTGHPIPADGYMISAETLEIGVFTADSTPAVPVRATPGRVRVTIMGPLMPAVS